MHQWKQIQKQTTKPPPSLKLKTIVHVKTNSTHLVWNNPKSRDAAMWRCLVVRCAAQHTSPKSGEITVHCVNHRWPGSVVSGPPLGARGGPGGTVTPASELVTGHMCYTHRPTEVQPDAKEVVQRSANRTYATWRWSVWNFGQLFSEKYDEQAF